MKKSLLCLVLATQLALASQLHAGGTQPEEKKSGGWFSVPMALVASLFFATDVEAGKVRVNSGVPSNDSKANVTEFMNQRVARGDACSGCFCDPCDVCPTVGPDCCADYDSCSSAYNSLNNAYANCGAAINSYEHELNTCQNAYDSCQFTLGSCQSAQAQCLSQKAQCQANLASAQLNLADKTALLIDRTNQLNACQANLATSQNTLNAVGAVCTDMNGCRQDVLNESVIQSALQEVLPNLNITSEVILAVKGALQRGLEGSQCSAGAALCANRTFPVAVACPTPASITATTCPPSNSSGGLTAPSYTLMAGLIGGSLFLNHHELITDMAYDTVNGIRSGVAQLKNALVGTSEDQSVE